MPDRPLVAQVVASGTGGGVRHLAALLPRLPPGLDVKVLAPDEDTPELRELPAGCLVPLPPSTFGRPSGIVRLRRMLKTLRPDLVHLHGTRAGIVGRLALVGTRTPVVYTIHGYHAALRSGLKARLILAVDRSLARRTSQILCVSHADRQLAAAAGLDGLCPIDVVHNGIETAAFEPRPFDGRPPAIVMVGRFHPQKDHATLVRAFARLAPAAPAWSLVLVGKGPTKPAVEALVQDLGIAGRVQFLENLPDVRNAFADASIAVLATHWEGLPLAVLEAQAMALPVVATDLPSVREAVSDASAVLVPPGDAAALAQALAALVEAPARRQRMGQAGRALVARQFDAQAMGAGVAAAYARLGVR